MIFDFGQEQSIEILLEAREQRMLLQEKLFLNFPNKTLISYSLNIPGPIKNNIFILEIFNEGLAQIKKDLKVSNIEIVYQKEINLNSGNNCFIMVNRSATEVKKQMIKLEDKTTFGRLFDIDILVQQRGKITQLSRSELYLNPRNCLICDKDAKICGRSREHSVEALQEKINHIYEKNCNNKEAIWK